MKTSILGLCFKPIISCIVLCLLLTTSCKKDDLPEVNESSLISQRLVKGETPSSYAAIETRSEDISICEQSSIRREDLIPEGEIIDLGAENGFRIDNGGLTIKVNEREIKLIGVEASFYFCDNGNLRAVSGKVVIPSPIDCIGFDDVFKTDIGFFTGAYINANHELDFQLEAERAYFVFYIGASLTMKLCTNLENPEPKPISISVPGADAEVLYLMDFSDPFFYLELEHESIEGRMAYAYSVEGRIPYVPIVPVPEMESFDCRSYLSGVFPLYKVMSVKGDLYQNLPHPVQLALTNPFEYVTEGYKAGINGEIGLSLPIGKDSSTLSKILKLEMNLGYTSAAINVLPMNNSIIARAFLNAHVQPDNSGWPAFIPIKPNREIDVTGYVQQDGQFNLLLRSEMGIQKSADDSDLVNSVSSVYVDNEALTLRGELNGPNEGWAIESSIGVAKTEHTLEVPGELLSQLNPDVTSEIQGIEDQLNGLIADLGDAEDQLDIELSLKGLKAKIPGITSYANGQINAAAKKIDDAVARVIPRSVWCSSPSTPIVKPYRDAINRLNRAVTAELSLETQRKEIKLALEGLIELKTITVSRISMKRKKVFGRGCSNISFPIPTVTETILTSSQVNTLQQAADNVQYIQPASNLVINLKEEIGELPSSEALDRLKNFEVPQLDGIGYAVEYSPSQFKYYLVLNGTRRYLDFDPFDWKSIVTGVRTFMESQL